MATRACIQLARPRDVNRGRHDDRYDVLQDGKEGSHEYRLSRSLSFENSMWIGNYADMSLRGSRCTRVNPDFEIYLEFNRLLLLIVP